MVMKVDNGEVFGRLTVLEEDLSRGKSMRYYQCQCNCGNLKSIRVDSLLNGDSRSCGCLAREKSGDRVRTHGHSKHRHYGRYRDMYRRCYDDRRKDFHHYGGRGIVMCDRWLEPDGKGFSNFAEDMEPTFKEGLELERVDVNGNYAPENCTWVSRKSQTNNLRGNATLEVEGLRLTTSEWGYLLGVDPKRINDRLLKLKWGEEKSVKTPFISRVGYYIHEGRKVPTEHFYKNIMGVGYAGYLKKLHEHNKDNRSLAEEYGADYFREILNKRTYDEVRKSLEECIPFDSEDYTLELFNKIGSNL